MVSVELYYADWCPFCRRAKALLDQKNVQYALYDVDQGDTKHTMIERAGGKTSVPQIFIDNQHIGGCDDLYALEGRQELDSLLQGK